MTFHLPDAYILVLTGAGVLIALVAWLPLALKRLPLSLPIVCIAIGMAIFSIPQVTLRPLPTDFPHVTERFAEFVAIVALMGAGLKIDRPFSWRGWGSTWRLLSVVMPLCIAAIAGLAWAAGLSPIAALLLGASLAPTDPVLASDVQVGPPKTGDEDEVRFALTSEAGLNDGFAFPFVNLAVALAAASATGEPWLWRWVGIDVFWEIGAGVAGGWLVGRIFGWLTFHVGENTRLASTGDGLIAIAATFVSYGFTEMIHCYGFLAVFVTAMTLRNSHRDHDFHAEMHDLTEQVERIAMMVFLLMFGGAIVDGVLWSLEPVDVALAFGILLVVRPLAGLAGLVGSGMPLGERTTVAFFGIRGIGTVYYVAYGLNQISGDEGGRLWAIVSLVVLLSILMHGLTVTPIMRMLDRERGVDPDADTSTPPPGLQGPAAGANGRPPGI